MHKVFICGIETSKLPKVTTCEAVDMMKKIKDNNDMEVREQFITANLRLVLSMVQRFDSKYESDDLFQVGCIGLIKAVNNFDMKYNVKFSTYAVPMIIGEMSKFIKESTSIRVTRSMRDTAYQALKARELIERREQKTVSLFEIAEEIDKPISEVACALNAISEPVSIYESVYNDEDDNLSLMDQLCNKDDTEINWTENIMLQKCVKVLTEKEKCILSMRYYRDKTQVEIANHIGVSQAQVSRLEKIALAKMRAQF